MTTFKIGDFVTFRKVYEGTFKVLDVREVPVDQIEFNPATGEGGVSHHQWLLIDSEDHPYLISGWYFEKGE